MSIFDLIILAILVALTLRGIWKGMISQIVSVAAFFICWVVATRFGSLVAPTIPLEAPANQVAAMAVIFVITLVAIRFAYAALEKFIKHWRLEKLNSLLGGVLGFTKGLLLCLIITFFAVMFSETSRDVVFNSKSGFHLVHIITKIGVFVPKDSYEFVHSQLAQFQEKVDKAVPGRNPETLSVQSSETVQRTLAQLQPAKGSFLTALSKWWNPDPGNPDPGNPDSGNPNLSGGTEKETPTKVSAQVSQATQKNEPNIPPAVTYSPPQSAASPPVVPTQKQAEPILSPVGQLAHLLPSAPETPTPSPLSPLTTLAPLTELLPLLPEPEIELLPTITVPHHVGSDLLLRNSSQTTKPDTSAKVFRFQN